MESNGNFQNWGDAITQSLHNVWARFLNGLPTFLVAVIVLIVGVLIASFLSKLVKKIVEYGKIDDLVDSTGVFKSLGTSFSISNVLSWVVKWFFIIVTLLAVVNILNIPQVTSFLQQVLLYIPNVVVAIIILALGVIAGNFVQNLVEGTASTSGLSAVAVDALAAISKWAVIIFSLMAALVQLGIASSLIQILFTGFVAMVALAGGLAFGLGGRDKASRWLDKIDQHRRD
jgi:hypothetical protein